MFSILAGVQKQLYATEHASPHYNVGYVPICYVSRGMLFRV